MKKGKKDLVKALLLDVEKSLNAKAEYLRGAETEEGALIVEGEMSELAWVHARLEGILKQEQEVESGSGESEESPGGGETSLDEAGAEGREKVGEKVAGEAEGGA